MIKRAQVVECARGYLGTPFQHQGRIRGRGVDCVGLPICVARDLGIKVEWILGYYKNYPAFPADNTVLEACRANLIEIPADQIREGDLLCCNVPMACHMAIVSTLPPNLGMIHAYNGTMKVVEHDIDEKWRSKIAGAFLFPGVED